MENLEELWNYFKSLPRPLPKHLNIMPGEFVINPEQFVDSHFVTIENAPPQLAQPFYERLVCWKEAYEKHTGAK